MYGPKARGVGRGDRHAALRVGKLDGKEVFRGPLQLPLIGSYLQRLQHAIKDGDGTVAMRDPRGSTRETKTEIRSEINKQLGKLVSTHHFPEEGGFVGKPPLTSQGDQPCEICDAEGTCLRASYTFFRGFPYHRKEDWNKTGSIDIDKGFFTELALDLRRLACILCAFSLFLVQFVLCFSELAPYARWQFRSQYADNKAQWTLQEGQKTNGQIWGEPLLPTECSYFKWSGVPVTYVGERNLDQAVLAR